MDNIGVRITADPSGVAPGVEQTKSLLGTLQSFVQQTTVSFKELGAQMKSAMSSGAQVGAGVAGGMKEARAATESETAALTAMVAKIHEGAESVRTFQMRAKEFAEVYVSMFAVEQIASFIKNMGEAAEKTTHLAQQFGMTTTEVQRLQGVATATGISVDTITRSMGFMDRNLANAAMGSKNLKQAFDAVGVSLNDGRSQMQKLEVVADKFKNMDDGPKKAALAMQLFGRSGREMIPVLNLGSAGIQQLNAKMDEYGVSSSDAVSKGQALAEGVNESKLGFMGMENVLTSALAPALKTLVDGFNSLVAAFIQSYDSGGTVKVIFTAIGDVIEVVVALVEALGSVFSDIWSVIVRVVTDIWQVVAQAFGIQIPKNVDASKIVLIEIKNVIEIVKDGIILFVDTAGAAFEALGKVVITFGNIVYDAMHLDWASIQSDWAAGMNGVVNIVHQAAGKIEADAKAMAGAIAAAAAGKAAPGTDTGGGIKLPGAGAGGDFDYNPTGGSKKQKKPKDDVVQKLEEELEAKKTAYEQGQLDQDQAQQYSLQSEADFWKQALARTDLSAKDRMEIQKKYNAAALAAQNELEAVRLDSMKREMEEDGKNWQKKIADAKNWSAEVTRYYGATSKEAMAAARDVEAVERAAAEDARKAWEEYYSGVRALAMGRVADAEESAKFEVDMGRISAGQLLQMQKQFENQRYQIETSALQQRLELMKKDPNVSATELQKLQNQIEQQYQQHEQKLNQIARQAALQRTQIERQAIGQVASGWADAIGKMVTLQQGFAATIKSIWTTVQQAIGSAIASYIQNWLTQQLSALILGKTQKLAEATGEIGANAGVAASGAYAATAAIPIVGPELAPAAAVTAYAGAISWLGSLSALSAEKGDWSVTEGLYKLHEKEMVLPSWAAEALRTSIGAGGGGIGGGFDSGPQLHLHGQIIHNPREIERWFKSNHRAVGAAVKYHYDQGGRG